MNEREDGLVAKLLQADRPSVLRYVASLINALTVEGRDGYLRKDLEALMLVNEDIHRLAGHMRDLCDFDEPLTPSRAEAIQAGTERLGPGGYARVWSFDRL